MNDLPSTSLAPLVSVIVPVYQGAAFLERALDSVRAQTYQPLETMVIDDGSTDDSAALAARREDVRCIRQAHGGVSTARNTGVAAARGVFIAFLDADDEWMPGKLARQVALLQAEPDVAFCFTEIRHILAPGIARPAWTRPEQFERDHVGYLPSSVVIRAEVLRRVGPFDVAREVGEDTDWFFRAKDLGLRSAVVPERLVLKYVHGANLSSRAVDPQRAILEMVRRSLQSQRAGRPASSPPEPHHES
jgi:glycosyltransferase involved in cell wall biosynthesis